MKEIFKKIYEVDIIPPNLFPTFTDSLSVIHCLLHHSLSLILNIIYSFVLLKQINLFRIIRLPNVVNVTIKNGFLYGVYILDFPFSNH